MKLIAIVILVLVQSLSAYAVREVQNGGAGVNSEQGMETFLSANFRLNGNPEAYQNIPGLTLLMSELDGMPIKDSVKGQIFGALFPTTDRQYFKVKTEDISPETRASLVDQFAQIMRVPKSKVVLFAASAPSTRTTVLLEGFYRLKPYEQAAMLLHEALWIMRSNLPYEQVIGMEQAAQGYFQDHSNTQALYNFVTRLSDAVSDRTLPLDFALRVDFQKGVFKSDAVGTRKVSLVDLVGERYLDCMLTHDFSVHQTRITKIDYVVSCNQTINYTAAIKSMQNQKSFYYKALSDYLGRYGFVNMVQLNDSQEYLTYTGMMKSYTEYRNGLYVDTQEPTSGSSMDMNIYNANDALVGRIRFQ